MTCDRRVVWLWWKFLSFLPKSLILLFGMCPSLLLQKSYTFCCIVSNVVRTCGLIWEFILSDALNKDWNNLLIENVTVKVVESLTMLFSYFWCERCHVNMFNICCFGTHCVCYNSWFVENSNFIAYFLHGKLWWSPQQTS